MCPGTSAIRCGSSVGSRPVRARRSVAPGRGHRLRSGPAGWLHSLTTQHLSELPPGRGTTTYVLLSPQGHIEHALYGVDDGQTFWAHTEPGAAPAAAAAWLDSMRFMMRVEVTDRTDEYAVVWQPGSAPRRGDSDPGWSRLPRRFRDLCSRAGLAAFLADGRGRAAGRTRLCGSPPECRGSGWTPTTARSRTRSVCWASAVHLDKGCYRGQETVARVNTLGRPPRRLVLLHLDGTAEALPDARSECSISMDARSASSAARPVTTSSGPIALGLVKRNRPDRAPLWSPRVSPPLRSSRRSRDRPARPRSAPLSPLSPVGCALSLSKGSAVRRARVAVP